MNFYEVLSVAIQNDMTEEEVAKRLFRSLINECWHSAEAFVKKRRAERNNSRLLAELEWLFKRWNP